MKLRELNTEAAIETKSQSVRDVLSQMYGVIQRFETDQSIAMKGEGEKLTVLKSMIVDMLKDSDQKRLIRGGQ